MIHLQYQGRTYSALAMGCLLPIPLLVGPAIMAMLEAPTGATLFTVFGVNMVVALLIIGATQASATFSIHDDHIAVSSVNYVLRLRRGRRVPWQAVRSATMLSTPLMLTHTGSVVGGSAITVHVVRGPPIRIVGRRNDPGFCELGHFHRMIEVMLRQGSAAAVDQAATLPVGTRQAAQGTGSAGCIVVLVLTLAACPLGGAAVWGLFTGDQSPVSDGVPPTRPAAPSIPVAPSDPGATDPLVPSPPASIIEGLPRGIAPMQAPEMRWDGRSTLICAGPMTMQVQDVTVNATFSPAIYTAGRCSLRLTNVDVTAPVVIEATGDSTVTVTGGSLSGSTQAIRASGHAQVRIRGASTHGPTQRSDAATIENVD